jgi:hypothetical protein
VSLDLVKHIEHVATIDETLEYLIVVKYVKIRVVIKDIHGPLLCPLFDTVVVLALARVPNFKARFKFQLYI